MSIRRAGRLGRPLLGAERLSDRVVVPISPTMKAQLVRLSGGHEAAFVRKLLARAFAGRRSVRRKKPSSKARAGKRRVNRFEET